MDRLTREFDLEATGTPRQDSIPSELNEDGTITNSVSENFRRIKLSGVVIQGIPSVREVAQFIAKIWDDCKHVVLVKLYKHMQMPTGFWILDYKLMSFLIFLLVDPLFFYAYEINSKEKCLVVNYFLLMGVFFASEIAFPVLHPRGRKVNVADRLILMLRVVVMSYDSVRLGESIISLTVLNLFLCVHLVKVIQISLYFKKATRASGIFGQARWTEALFHLLLYVHAAHVFGALWYFFAIKRQITYWKEACCLSHNGCNLRYFFCGDGLRDREFLNDSCPTMTQDKRVFDFGIFHDALESGIAEVTNNFPDKLLYCLRWGLQTLSCFGQNLQPSTYAAENIFVISICISTLLLFSFLVGNIETYLQSETEPKKSEEMSGGQEGEDKRVMQGPEPIGPSKNIKIELCLKLLRKVKEFEKWSESSLKDLCGYLKPVSFIERTHIIREGDPIDEMLFVVQGKLQIYTTDNMYAATGTRGTGHYNRKHSHLKDGDFFGNELVTRIQADPYTSKFPNSDRNIRAITNVEAFALMANDLQNVIVNKAAVLIQSFWRSRRPVQAPTQRHRVNSTDFSITIELNHCCS